MNSLYKFIIFGALLSLLLNLFQIQAQIIPETFGQNRYDALIKRQYDDALNLFINQQYKEAIPLLEYIINTSWLIKGYHEYKADWQYLLGTCYHRIGKLKEAENIYLRSLKYLEDHHLLNAECTRRLYNSLSLFYAEINNYEKAAFYCDKAKISYEQNLDFGDGYITCLANGSAIWSELGYLTQSKMFADVAIRQSTANLKHFESLNDSILITIKENGLNTQLEKQSIISQINNHVSLLNNASQIYYKLGYHSEAIRALQNSIHLAERYDLPDAIALNNLGMVYLRKASFKQAVECLQKAYVLSLDSYEKNSIGINLVLGLFLSNNSEASSICVELSARIRNEVQKMFAFMSGEERARYWDKIQSYFPNINLIIYKGGGFENYGVVYDNILESKGLLLRSTNAIREAILNSGNVSDKKDYERICQLKKQVMLESDPEKIKKQNREIDEIDKRLTQHVHTYVEFINKKSINWVNVRDALADDEMAIEFSNMQLIFDEEAIDTPDCEAHYYAVVLKKSYNGPHIIPLCREVCLKDLNIEDCYDTDSIYNLIWKPIEDELKGIRNIYFAADGDLHKIGIEYSHVPRGGMIGDEFNIYRLSSTRVLAEDYNERRTDKAVLYGGLRYDIEKEELIAESRSGNYHPTYASRSFSYEKLRYGVKYLPGTLQEVEEISNNFSVSPLVKTGINGTEESFKDIAGQPVDIIHLATHGFFWSEEDAQKRNYVTFLNPVHRTAQSAEDNALMRSGLFFSGANIGLKGEELPDDVEDGVLTALELSNMNLGHVDMVVMSACESGLGETSSEGVFGLQRGFKLAGANTLLMSLWKVDDVATQLLMTEFYRNYLSGKSKQESLKLAQQSLRNSSDYSDPQYWAAFILLDGLN